MNREHLELLDPLREAMAIRPSLLDRIRKFLRRWHV